MTNFESRKKLWILIFDRLFYCFEHVWSICNLQVIVCYACVIHVLWCVMLSLCSVNVSHIVLHSFDILMHSNEATHQGRGPRNKITKSVKQWDPSASPSPPPFSPKSSDLEVSGNSNHGCVLLFILIPFVVVIWCPLGLTCVICALSYIFKSVL